MPLSRLVGRKLTVPRLDVVLSSFLHDLQHFKRTGNYSFIECILESFEVSEVNSKQAFAFVELYFNLAMIDADIFLAEAIEELLEVMMEVSVGALEVLFILEAIRMTVEDCHTFWVHLPIYMLTS